VNLYKSKECDRIPIYMIIFRIRLHKCFSCRNIDDVLFALKIGYNWINTVYQQLYSIGFFSLTWLYEDGLGRTQCLLVFVSFVDRIENRRKKKHKKMSYKNTNYR